MLNRSQLARGVSNYFRNHGGHITTVTALIGLPLLLMISIALDIGNVSAKRASIALDAAALAAVIPANLTDDERIPFAKKGSFTKKLTTNA